MWINSSQKHIMPKWITILHPPVTFYLYEIFRKLNINELLHRLALVNCMVNNQRLFKSSFEIHSVSRYMLSCIREKMV